MGFILKFDAEWISEVVNYNNIKRKKITKKFNYLIKQYF